MTILNVTQAQLGLQKEKEGLRAVDYDHQGPGDKKSAPETTQPWGSRGGCSYPRTKARGNLLKPGATFLVLIYDEMKGISAGE